MTLESQQKKSVATVLVALLIAEGIASAEAAAYVPASVAPPPPRQEFRGAWIATVANLDWPSRPGLSTTQQKVELLGLLDRAVQLKLNAIIFQVRPGCDAFYVSQFEPWSEYLTGTMGQAPRPFYDPLAFAVEEAHRRGLELHAWFNPFRARHSGTKSPVAPAHVSKSHSRFVRQYGSQLWLDPGDRDAADYSLAVIMDVVRRYDIDGVHLDDYFYPYPEKDARGRELQFPDESSWQRFGAGAHLERADWRRQNINHFIHRTYQSIKAVKPWVKFGISPFGIWRPGNPPPIQGFDPFSKLYADSRTWLAEGWVDYMAPQLYWAIDARDQSFPTLLKWWAEQNAKGRQLFAGLDSTKATGKWKPEEILNQIRLTRQQPGVEGHIHWDMNALLHNRTLDVLLERDLYRQPALVPAATWLGGARPAKPRVSVSGGTGRRSLRIQWRPGGLERPWLWIFQTRARGEWKTDILPVERMSRAWDGPLPEVIAVTAVNRNGAPGPATALILGGK